MTEIFSLPLNMRQVYQPNQCLKNSSVLISSESAELEKSMKKKKSSEMRRLTSIKVPEITSFFSSACCTWKQKYDALKTAAEI